ncbi:tape measure protein [Streptococcus hyointestinalis]|uniref:Phage protein n=1 Tax=Streptococcus hyointestinalis TaxID=1337 RepID=A0A380K6N2_9STRE|nr:tape measure protein [Streptococcus hyointestinalis]SUN60611.1 phage protein [Streptococcus hyointestinalis]
MADGSVTIKVDLDGSDAQSGVSKLKNSLNGLEGAGSKVGSVFKSVLGANLISSALTTGISTITNGVRDMMGELNSSQKAWKTFEGNLQAFGRSAEEINAAKTEMQDFATKTIYSASDMASTYSQLDAVGTKNVGSLVKAFGGLAASAENPAQAMKSLSTQATQMASKPKIAWMDFKIMMEQAPAGMAAVAKEMGMSTAELVSAVQDGKVNTEDFFDAMNRAGNSDAFQKMATEFKTVDQAIDGAKESLSNSLMPAFEQLNQFGIKAVVAISDALEKINFDKLASNLGNFLGKIDVAKGIENIQQAFKTVFNPLLLVKFQSALDSVKGAIGSIGAAFQSAGGSTAIFLTISNVIGAVLNTISTGSQIVQKFLTSFTQTGAVKALKDAFDSLVFAYNNVVTSIAQSSAWSMLGTVIGTVVTWISKAVSAIGNFVASLPSGVLATLTTGLVGLVAGFKAFNFLKSFNPFSLFKKNATSGVSGASSAVKSAGSSMVSIVKSLGKSVATAAKGIGSGLASAFRGIGQGLAMVNPATIAALAVPILALGAAFALMGMQGQGIATILQGVGSVVVSVGTAIGTILNMAIQGLASALVIVAPVLPIVAQSFAMLSPLVMAAGAAISMIISSFSSLAPVITALGIALSQVITAISSGVTQIVTAVTPIIQIIANAFVAVVPVVAGAIVQIVQALAPFIPAVTQMVQAVAPVLTGIVDAFNNLISQISPIIDSISNLFKTLGEQISSILDSARGVIESFGGAIRNVLDGVAGIFDSIGNAAKNAGQGVKLMAQGVKILVDLNLGDLIGTLAAVAGGLGAIAASGIVSAGPGLQQAGQGLRLIAQSAQQASLAMMTLPTALTVFSASLTTIPAQLLTITTSFTTFGASLALAFATIPATLTTVTASFMVFSSSVTSSLAGFSMLMSVSGVFQASLGIISGSLGVATASMSAFGGEVRVVVSSMSSLGASASAAASAMAGMGVGISGSLSAVVMSVTSAGNRMVTVMQASMNRIVTVVRNGMTNAASAVRNGASQMVSALRSAGVQMVTTAQSMVNQTVNAVRNGRSAMQSAGQYMAQGLAVGMRSALSEVTRAANELVAQAEKAAKAKAKINSPSHLFRDEVGWWIGLGVAKGIDNSAPEVANSLDFIRDQVHGFSLKSQNLLTGATASMSSQLRLETLRSKTPKVESDARQEAYIAHSASLLSDVIDSLESLRDQVAQGQHIILDTGALVGGTANKIDARLGQNTQLGGRLSFR